MATPVETRKVFDYTVDQSAPFWRVNSSVRVVPSPDMFGEGESKWKNADKILEAGPWHIQNQPLIVRKWEVEMEVLDFNLSKLPVWFLLSNIPLELFTQRGIACIESTLGQPLYMDKVTAQQQRLAYAQQTKATVQKWIPKNKKPVVQEVKDSAQAAYVSSKGKDALVENINPASSSGSEVPVENLKEKESGSTCATEQSEEMLKNQSGFAGEVKEKKRAMNYREGKKEIGVDDTASDSSSIETKEPLAIAYPGPEFNDFEKECFSVGQIWALYDTLDVMPRFYAQIRKVFSSGFKLRITWLEPDPDDENKIKWVSESLPVSCGNCKIFPRKGETRTLFKNWNIGWKSGSGSDLKFEYEFVEILSEDAEGVGIHVAYVTKVKGFVSVFCRMSKDGVNTFLIPPNELFRFSHKNPSFVLTEEERKQIPGKPGGRDCWSIIESNPVFRIHVTWLLPCPTEGTTQWYDEEMPTCCGRFRTEKSSQAYSSTYSFSHKLKADPIGRKDEYTILPRKDEIWALYRNWCSGIKCCDLENWEYDIVQVIEETDQCIKIRFSHQISFFQLTDERNGEQRGFWELDPVALPRQDKK
ncbi:hypothetical protein PTKIN_Ptkin10aG0024200 [Pterospermum kingtungense]